MNQYRRAEYPLLAGLAGAEVIEDVKSSIQEHFGQHSGVVQIFDERAASVKLEPPAGPNAEQKDKKISREFDIYGIGPTP